MKTAQIHRYGDKVAIYIGTGQTVYLTPEEAKAIAKVLNACARNVKEEPKFSHSNFKTVEFKFNSDI